MIDRKFTTVGEAFGRIRGGVSRPAHLTAAVLCAVAVACPQARALEFEREAAPPQAGPAHGPQAIARMIDEAESAYRAPHRRWRVDEARMATTAGGNGFFMHCLPVRRNVVVTDGVLDGPWSVVVDQAENRLHAQRALLLELIGDRC